MTTFMLPLSLWWLFSILLIVKGNSIVEVKEILTIAGNFSLNGKFTNLAHYDISTGVWSSSNEPDLYVYGESNGKETLCQKSRLFVLLIYMLCCPGVLWDTKVNRSSHTGPNGNSVDELFVVGAFDTVSKTSQVSSHNVSLAFIPLSYPRLSPIADTTHYTF